MYPTDPLATELVMPVEVPHMMTTDTGEVIISNPVEVIETPIKQHKHKNKKRHKRKKKMASVETPSFLATGGMGDGGIGGIGGVLVGALLARGGLLGNEGGRREGEGCVTPSTLSASLAGVTDAIQNTTVMQTLGTIQGSIPLAEGQVQLALAGVNQDITSQSLQQTIALQQQGFNGQLANLTGFSTTKDAVDSLSTQVAVGQGVTNTNIERLGWQVSQAISTDGEKTRALIGSIDRDNLNRMLTTAQNEIIELRGDRRRDDDRHGIEINMINNQNQNQMQFQQQAQVLNTLATGLSAALQNIQATNQAINIGAGTQTANPTNTNTNVRA